jgi:hypothetical protein
MANRRICGAWRLAYFVEHHSGMYELWNVLFRHALDSSFRAKTSQVRRRMSSDRDPLFTAEFLSMLADVGHYHTERNHQGLANQLISPDPGDPGNWRRGTAAPAGYRSHFVVSLFEIR